MMTPEGASPQDTQGQPQQDPTQGIAEGISALSQGTQALLQGLTDAKAPPELVKLAQTAADSISQIESALGGGAQDSAGAPPASQGAM